VGVRITRAPWYRAASACATPETSRPAIGCAGTNDAARTPSAARATCTTSLLVEPKSITSISGVINCLMVSSSAPVAATGTASTTRSAPATASRAEGADTSMMPIWHASSVVEGDLL